jgi:nitrogen fixation NifU-like protein
MPDIQDLYAQMITRLARCSYFCGSLPDATHQATKNNSLCGDTVTVSLIVRDGFIFKALYEAESCVITRASARMMAEAIIGATPELALRMAASVDLLVRGKPIVHPLNSDILVHKNVSEFPNRLSCAMLPWNALLRALSPS